MKTYKCLNIYKNNSYCLNPHHDEGDIEIDERFSKYDNIENFLEIYSYVKQKTSLINFFAIKYFREHKYMSGSFDKLILIK